NIININDRTNDCVTTAQRLPNDEQERKACKECKEQQPQTPSSFAAAVIPTFYPILIHDQRLSDEDRVALMKFSEDRVNLALQFSQNQPYKTTLIRLLVWHCKQPIPPTVGKVNENITKSSHTSNGSDKPKFSSRRHIILSNVKTEVCASK